MARRAPAARPHHPRVGSLIGSIFFGLVLATAGGFFCWYLWVVGARARAMDAWPAVPCLIVESTVIDEAPVPGASVIYRPRITYRYDVGGVARLGTRIKRVTPQSTHRERMERLIAGFPTGARSTCYVDPDDPGSPVLIRDSKAALYSLWFPFLFVIGGLGLASGALRRHFRSTDTP